MTRNTNDPRRAAASPLNRRKFLKGSSIAATAAALNPRLYAAAGGLGSKDPIPVPIRHTLLSIFLRGGADGLSICVPFADTVYQTQRSAALQVQSFVGIGDPYWDLPAALSSLQPIWQAGHLAIIPGAGYLDEKDKSHFVAMDKFEYGTPPASQGHAGLVDDGWAARHLLNASFSTTPVLRGLMMNKLATKTFARAPLSLAIEDVTNFEFPGTDPLLKAATQLLYEEQAPPPSPAHAMVTGAATNTFNAMDYLDSVNFTLPTGAYPATDFGDQLKRLAALILNKNPPELVQINLGGWDHHNNQDPNNQGGQMYDLMVELGDGLAAFYSDMAAMNSFTNQPWRNSVTVIVNTEFGRRIAGNSSDGTDHGWGQCMLAIGGSQVVGGIHVTGGPAVDGWLAANADPEGDLTPVTDHRDVIVQALTKLMNLGNATDVFFPGYVPNPNVNIFV